RRTTCSQKSTSRASSIPSAAGKKACRSSSTRRPTNRAWEPTSVTPERPDDIGRVIRPRSIAIVGVSPEPGSVGGAVLANLTRFGYGGDVHLVSRSSDAIDGRRCLASIADLPEGVDVAVLAVPGAAIGDAVAACVQRSVGAAIIYAAGFAEAGEGGRGGQEGIARPARGGGV